MKIFQIGAAGGVGLRLAKMLTSRGDKIIGMHRRPKQATQLAGAGPDASPLQQESTLARPSAIVVLGLSLGAGLLLTACTPTTPPPGPTPHSTTASPAAASSSASSGQASSAPVPSGLGTPEVVASGLAAPWSVASLDGTALVSERDSGRILELASDGTARAIGTVPGVEHAGESGLLGLAVDPQGRLHAYSSAAEGNRIQRFTITGAPGH